MTSASSWISSLSCSSSSVMADDTSVTSLILQWIRFIFLSPCPQRALISSIDVLFLLILFIFALQKLYSRFSSNKNGSSSAIDEPLIAKNRALIKTTLWFKLSLVVTAILALLSVVSSILAFTQNTQKPWKLIAGICWLIQAVCFLTITILIIHEKKFKAVIHPLSLRVFWVANFITIVLLATSSIIRLVTATENSQNTSVLKSEDIISLISLPFSVFLLIAAITGSTGITVTAQAESINGNGVESEADDLNKSSNVSGWASASITSKVFWLWMNPLLKKGTKPLSRLMKSQHFHRNTEPKKCLNFLNKTGLNLKKTQNILFEPHSFDVSGKKWHLLHSSQSLGSVLCMLALYSFKDSSILPLESHPPHMKDITWC